MSDRSICSSLIGPVSDVFSESSMGSSWHLTFVKGGGNPDSSFPEALPTGRGQNPKRRLRFALPAHSKSPLSDRAPLTLAVPPEA